jgi:hypothetical protein
MASRRDVVGFLGLAGAAQLMTPAAGGVGRIAAPAAECVVIPFTLESRTGRVAITYAATQDPIAAGFDAIPNLPFDVTLCRGYPNLHAVIERYDGSGYRGLCGWIQVVTGKRYHADNADAAPADTSIDLDKLPSIGDMDLPFAAFGYLPEWFDAPCRNLNGYDRLHWTADTFLTTIPLRSRDEKIQRLAGFRWGYVEYAPEVRRPVSLLPLTVTGADAWNSLVPFLGKSSPGWRFAE